MHDYHDESKQLLFKAEAISASSYKSRLDNHPILHVGFEIHLLSINWKPDILLLVLDLTKKLFPKEKKTRMDDWENKDIDKHF